MGGVMRRTVLSAAVLTGALLALAAASAPVARADPTLEYGCNPPLPSAPENCSRWNTGPVHLAWTWTNGNPVNNDACSPRTFTQDTPSLSITCVVQDGSTQLGKTAVIRIDMTPPTVTGATPARPPDHDGWWNHPVAFAFGGSDATSGIAACDTVNYSGPDGAEAQVAGTCRDQAGNSATRAIALRYDATPPTLRGVTASSRDRRATVRWSASVDTVLKQVVRSPGIRGRASSLVYGGSAGTFTDTAVSNGVTYRYTVTAYDAAGNAASARVSTTPGSLRPAWGARLRRPPLLRWPQVKGASYYNVQLFRGRRKVMSAWPARNRLQLHRSWNFRGHRLRLTRGLYRWHVWPGFGSRLVQQYGRRIGQSSFYIRV
jgi:hypothetical protein